MFVRIAIFVYISIHALREEGDVVSASSNMGDGRGPDCKAGLSYFYPRPPRGGRRKMAYNYLKKIAYFYPRPPRGGRPRPPQCPGITSDFYPRPPRGGRRSRRAAHVRPLEISIHALREEGDVQCERPGKAGKKFLSTPSARRATLTSAVLSCSATISIHALREEGDAVQWNAVEVFNISIHALREEGDLNHGDCPPYWKGISIHALREEGDQDCRQFHQRQCISIHALREEGDCSFEVLYKAYLISIHALREEGDVILSSSMFVRYLFLSTPSARRATGMSSEEFSSAWKFLSTPSARRATWWQCRAWS